MLDAAVDGNVGVAVAVVEPLIVRVTAIVEAAVVDLKALVDLNLSVDALLTLDGTVIAVHVCAQLIVDIIVVRSS